MRIAIIKLSALGDIVHSMIVLEFIKKHFPDAVIDWFVDESLSKALELNPYISNIIGVKLKEIRKSKSLKLLKQEVDRVKSLNSYDYIIDLQGLLKSALLTYLLKGDSFGFDKFSIKESFASNFYDKKFQIPYSENVIIRNIYLVSKALKFKFHSDEIFSKEPFFKFENFKSEKVDNLIENSKKNIVLVVGASIKNKIYPKEKFLKVISKLDENIIAISGNESEREIAEYISKSSENTKVAPSLNLNELKYLIYKSNLTIGGDTGPTHIAWALNRASITIFGNTPKSRNSFPTEINRTINSSSRVDPLNIDKRDFSIGEISSQKIVNLALEILYGR